jgi:intracellular sulfur oxidation DsrE/DsrF family protein
MIELSDFSRIHNLEELYSLPPNSVIIIANNNHAIANFINEKKKSSWKTSNLSIVDIGGLIRNTDELFELTNLENLKL